MEAARIKSVNYHQKVGGVYVESRETHLTPEEYLAIERAAETKSEYFNCEMFMVVELNRWHNLIVGNIACEIRQSFID